MNGHSRGVSVARRRFDRQSKLLHDVAMDGQLAPTETAEARILRQAVLLEELLAKLVRNPKEHALSDVELSYREIRLMLALDAQSEMTMTDLATALAAPLSTVTRMMDRLEAKGLIERFRSVQDRRIVLVHSSDKGRLLHDAFQQHRFEIARRMLEPLSFGEREILLELMEKLTHSLGQSKPD